MRLKHDFKEDNLQRIETAEHYVRFINKLEGNHTIALDAPWGSGKSTFIDFMCEELDKKKDIYITYNAWENDYTDDPFLSLMSEFFEQVVEKEYVGEDKLKNAMASTWAASKHIGKGLFKGATKAVIGSEAMENLSDGIEEIAKGTISASAELAINKAFKDISASKKTRTNFKDELEVTTKKILEEKSKDKLIIIIDELDRCKPTFAIELLENIKHLFAIDEIIFLIAVDKVQLAESIKAVYGAGFDATTYLHRFFDFELHLKKRNIINYFNLIIENKLNTKSYVRMSDFIVKIFDLTLRDFERIVSEILLLKTINPKSFSSINIPLYLLIIKYKKPEIYTIICENSSLNFSEMDIKINSKINSKDFSSFWFSDFHHCTAHKDGTPKYSQLLTNQTTELLNIIESTL